MASRYKKILNDPVYGFISLPDGLLFNLIEHPFFQRLRRIKQLGMTHYVYPGAMHTRFHHALGSLHLMSHVIEVLRGKGTTITEPEKSSVQSAILLHDIGHGPFSHALENTLVPIPHEKISQLFMEYLNREFDGALDMAIGIFKKQNSKQFLHQLVSGQLDMDRMDYLIRDSYFTGVHEGVIGYDRILKMLAVWDDRLVVEEKGYYSIEKFLVARRLMYWQVYLHKTVLAAEQMLISVLKRAKELARNGLELPVSDALKVFLYNNYTANDFTENDYTLLQYFARIDDYDIISALKAFEFSDDPVLSYLSSSLLHRRLFRAEIQNQAFDPEYIEKVRKQINQTMKLPEEYCHYLCLHGEETNSAYSTKQEEIYILYKNGTVEPVSDKEELGIKTGIFTKYYFCYPKQIEVNRK